MKNKLKILKAYWYRFWHCLFLTCYEFPNGHSMCGVYLSDGFNKNETIYIGCTCGKDWYNPRNTLPFENWELARRAKGQQ